MGKENGDKAMMILADSMRKNFPPNTLFARLNDAVLMALCNENEMISEIISNIERDLEAEEGFNIPLGIQSAVSMVTEKEPDISEAIEVAVTNMNAKKMLDRNSAHSSLLDLLVQIQLEADAENEAHMQNTGIIGKKLADRLNLSDIQKSRLALLCLLHDIGKIGIPIEILNKPGPLTKRECDVMKTHVEKGYRILSTSEELRLVSEDVLYHHERWDGKGYPDGLEKEAIPLLSRIIAILDEFDMMTADRPYRPAISKSEAKAQLRKDAGVKFDPYIAAEFIEMLDEEEQLDEEVLDTDKSIIDMQKFSETLTADSIDSESSNMCPICYGKYKLDQNMNIIEVNEEFSRITGYTCDDIETYDINQLDLILPEERLYYATLAKRLMQSEQAAYIEHRIRRKDGTAVYVLCFGRMYYDSADMQSKTEIILTDIESSLSLKVAVDKAKESIKRNRMMWEDRFRKDTLTSVFNKEAFKNESQMRIFSSSDRMVMIMCDLDKFKQYNDSYGHVKGDELLMNFAKALTNAVSGNGFVGRMGGDEFAIMLSYDKSINDDEIHAELDGVWNRVSAGIRAFDRTIKFSMGVYVADESVDSFDKLYMRSDEALYKAKNSGRDRMVIDGDIQCADDVI